MATAGKVKKIYNCSNVGLDYFFLLCKTLERDDWEVIPVYLLPEQKYRQFSKSNKLKKSWLRFQMYCIYPMMLFFKALFAESGSIFIVSSNTFYAPLVIAVLLRFRNIKVVHLLYDLYPDALEVAGATEIESSFSRTLGKLTKLNQSLCEGTVYLGDFLRKHAETRWGKAKRSATIHISTNLPLYDSDFRENTDKQKIVIHYGGQLGYLHDAVSIIACLKDVLSSELAEKVEFNFYVSGAQAPFLEKELRDYPVKIIAAIPSDQWRQDIKAFHIGLVSLIPGGASVCFPSKTYGMMAGGMAIITICPVWSDLANLVLEMDAGWVVNNSIYESVAEMPADEYLKALNRKRNPEGIKQEFRRIISEVIQQPDVLLHKRKNAFYGVRDRYNVSLLRTQWHSFIKDLG
jgi:hypothetical protein